MEITNAQGRRRTICAVCTSDFGTDNIEYIVGFICFFSFFILNLIKLIKFLTIFISNFQSIGCRRLLRNRISEL